MLCGVVKWRQKTTLIPLQVTVTDKLNIVLMIYDFI